MLYGFAPVHFFFFYFFGLPPQPCPDDIFGLVHCINMKFEMVVGLGVPLCAIVFGVNRVINFLVN